MGDMLRLKLLTAVSYLVDANILTSFLLGWQNIGEWTLIPRPRYPDLVTAQTGQGQLGGRCRDSGVFYVFCHRTEIWIGDTNSLDITNSNFPVLRCCINLLRMTHENLTHQGQRYCCCGQIMLMFDLWLRKAMRNSLPKVFEFAVGPRVFTSANQKPGQCLCDQWEGLRKRHAMLTKINKISDVLSLILDPVFYPCHNILSERSNKEAVPAMMPKKYED